MSVAYPKVGATMKYRKPRFSEKRIVAAQQYIKLASAFINESLVQQPSNDESAARITEYNKNKKSMSIGKEFITDLLLWQKSQLEASRDNNS